MDDHHWVRCTLRQITTEPGYGGGYCGKDYILRQPDGSFKISAGYAATLAAMLSNKEVPYAPVR